MEATQLCTIGVYAGRQLVWYSLLQHTSSSLKNFCSSTAYLQSFCFHVQETSTYIIP